MSCFKNRIAHPDKVIQSRKLWNEHFALHPIEYQVSKKDRYYVEFEYAMKSLVIGDIDKLCRFSLDSMTQNSIIADDRYVQRISANKVQSDSEYVKIHVYLLN